MTRLIIARHGNTFGPGETPRRVGARTDIPLVESGMAQAMALRLHLQASNLIPDIVFTSQLRRTKETAGYALEAMDLHITSEPLAIFKELDYGPDENKPEPDVVARLGEQADLPVAAGIYAVTLGVEGGPPLPAVGSLGTNPTFVDGGRLVLEVHVLDWDGDLYDRRVRTMFVAYLRPEQKFASIEALIEQIRRDIDAARPLLV